MLQMRKLRLAQFSPQGQGPATLFAGFQSPSPPGPTREHRGRSSLPLGGQESCHQSAGLKNTVSPLKAGDISRALTRVQMLSSSGFLTLTFVLILSVDPMYFHVGGQTYLPFRSL